MVVLDPMMAPALCGGSRPLIAQEHDSNTLARSKLLNKLL